MTNSAFDPICFGQYPADDPPRFIHFEYEGSTDIHRYMLVDRIPSHKIDSVTRRQQGEGTDSQLQRKYIMPTSKLEVPVKCTCGKVLTSCEDCIRIAITPLGETDGPVTEMGATTEGEPPTEDAPDPAGTAPAEQPEAPANS